MHEILIPISSRLFLENSLLETIVGFAEVVVAHGSVVLHLEAELEACEERAQIEATASAAASADFFHVVVTAQQIVYPRLRGRLVRTNLAVFLILHKEEQEQQHEGCNDDETFSVVHLFKVLKGFNGE